MIQQKLTIPGELTPLNDYIKEINKNKHAGNRVKQEETDRCAWYAKEQLRPIDRPVRVTFHWYSRHRKHDIDNVDAARKFVLDGLQVAGILKNDTRKYVADLGKPEFFIDKDNPRVEVLIEVLDAS